MFDDAQQIHFASSILSRTFHPSTGPPQSTIHICVHVQPSSQPSFPLPLPGPPSSSTPPPPPPPPSPAHRKATLKPSAECLTTSSRSSSCKNRSRVCASSSA